MGFASEFKCCLHIEHKNETQEKQEHQHLSILRHRRRFFLFFVFPRDFDSITFRALEPALSSSTRGFFFGRSSLSSPAFSAQKRV